MPLNETFAAIALSTVGNEADAERIARHVVEEQLAACVNIVGPIRSVYRWRGAIEDDREFLLILKTANAQLRKLEDRIKELHSYEVPEFLVVKVERGSEQYLSWLLSSVGPAK